MAIEFSVRAEPKIESALRGAMGHLAKWHTRVVFIQGNRFARLVHRLEDISANEVGVVLDWVNARIALFTLHETSVGAHRLRLGCVSLMHFCY